MTEKVDIQEIANVLIASAEREEELLAKNASLQEEIASLKANNNAISFVDAGGDTFVSDPAATPHIQENTHLEKEASMAFDPYNMGEVASTDDSEIYSNASERLMNWVEEL